VGVRAQICGALCAACIGSHALHPTLYTLHPTPYTLQPTPYTPNPSPQTLHPTPYTLKASPQTLNPSILKLSTLIPKPDALHLKTETRNPTPRTVEQARRWRRVSLPRHSPAPFAAPLPCPECLTRICIDGVGFHLSPSLAPLTSSRRVFMINTRAQ